MKALKIALIVLAAVILTPIIVAQGVALYLVAREDASEAKARQDEIATVATAGARDCVSMKHKRPSAWDVGDDKYRQYLKDWIELCQREAASDTTPAVQLSLYEALFAADRRPEAIVVLRKVAATDNTEALRAIYEWHRSWESGDVNRKQIVERKEAGEALRRAAWLGDTEAMTRYATNLSQGSIIKRDVDTAAYWMERAYKNPPKNTTQADIIFSTAHLLAESEDPEKRARGIRILEANSNSRAKAYLGEAIRKNDPVRARALFEETLRAWPGVSLPPLAEMLINGEGGPADPKRAVKLLQSYSRVSAPASINAALGKLYAEGKHVPRDPEKAAELMSGDTQWSVQAKLDYARFLIDHPDVKANNAPLFLYRLTDIAEIGEPGAMDALIALKLTTRHYADKAGGCRLAQRAVAAGNEGAKKFLAACGVN